jgi:hypothetical protein
VLLVEVLAAVVPEAVEPDALSLQPASAAKAATHRTARPMELDVIVVVPLYEFCLTRRVFV